MRRKIRQIIEFSKDHPDFDTSFIRSVEGCDTVTPKQKQAVENIYSSFHVEDYLHRKSLFLQDIPVERLEEIDL